MKELTEKEARVIDLRPMLGYGTPEDYEDFVFKLSLLKRLGFTVIGHDLTDEDVGLY